jgi:hypothetical protein
MIVRAAAVTAALAVSCGAASAYGSTAGTGSASLSSADRHLTLKAGESWSRVVWDLSAHKNCNGVAFGDRGTQMCDGSYQPNPHPVPSFGGWGFNDGHDGTVHDTAYAGQTEMHVYFFTPGADIRGWVVSAASDRYTVTSSQGPRGWSFKSPSDSPDYDKTPAGEKGGPLHIRVYLKSVSRAGGGLKQVYVFAVYGWVVVVHQAR